MFKKVFLPYFYIKFITDKISLYKQLSRYTVLLKKFVKQPFIIFKYQDLMCESVEPPDLLLSLKSLDLTDYKSHQSPTFTLTVDSFDLKY